MEEASLFHASQSHLKENSWGTISETNDSGKGLFWSLALEEDLGVDTDLAFEEETLEEEDDLEGFFEKRLCSVSIWNLGYEAYHLYSYFWTELQKEEVHPL